MRAEAAKYLWDATEAARAVLRFAAGKTWTDYQSDEVLRAAVERQLIIVGEALSRVRQLDPQRAARIRELPRVVGLRNVLVHGYAQTDHLLVWGLIDGPLPALIAELEAL
jgi:uncharacterized protein with HEPN domain